MATTEARPESPVSPGDGGLWINVHSNSTPDMSGRAEGDDPSLLLAEPEVTPPSPPPSPPPPPPRYYSVMDDEVFLFPAPPPCAAPSRPAEGGVVAGERAAVRVTGGAKGVTEGNPTGLDGPHAERQSTAAQGQTALTATRSSSAETMAEKSPEKRPRIHQDDTEETGREGPGTAGANKQHGGQLYLQSNANMVGAVSTDTVAGTTRWFYEETSCEPLEEPAAIRPSSAEREALTPTEDSGAEAMGETAAWGGGPPELCPYSRLTEEETALAGGAAGAAESEEDSDEGSVDSQPLDYAQTRQQWVRRDSATTEVPLPLLFTPLRRSSSAGQVTRPRSVADLQVEDEGKEEAGRSAVAAGLQQGEQLLQRLLLVQQRQDDRQVAAGVPPPHQGVTATANRAAGGPKAETDEGGRTEGASGEGGRRDQTGTERRREEQEESAKEGERADRYLTCPILPRPRQTALKMEADGSDNDDDNQSDSGVSADFSPAGAQETPSSQAHTPDGSARRPLPAPEEREARRAPRSGRADARDWRTRGVDPDVDEDPDVVEIPFKHTVLTKPVPSARQFSQQKMQREISQETQRELVLVNMGKIPGGYSKGTVRQMKERRMLFEAFQQGNTDAPTGLQRNPVSSSSSLAFSASPSSSSGPALRHHVYPSVLERTRSMEMLSLKSFRISRSQSLRLVGFKGSEEPPRSESPGKARREGGGRGGRPAVVTARDANRLAPYMKQEKHRRLYKSMDALNIDVRDLSEERARRGGGGGGGGGGGTRRREGGDEREALSSVLQGNPFFKLRPALALKPEVAKDIREAREREEELRRQRSAPCGQRGPAEGAEGRECYPSPAGRSPGSSLATTDLREGSKGKLDRMWPPPSSMKDKPVLGQIQQEPMATRAAGQKTPLWQRWEDGMVNGQQPKEKN